MNTPRWFFLCITVSGLLMGSAAACASAPSKPSIAQLRAKAMKGDSTAEVALGRRLRAEKKHAASARWLRKAALQGNPQGEMEFGVDEFFGSGVPAEREAGLRWMTRAARQGGGKRAGMLGLALALAHGPGPETIHWWKVGASRGSAQCMKMLGVAYAMGKLGADKDTVQAVHWLKAAVAAGDANAATLLGEFYFHKALGKPDPVAGLRWLRRAAGDHDAQGEARLARRYATGRGVKKNPALALNWARRAATQGNAEGYYTLGLLHARGEGLPAAPGKAWYDFAMAARLDRKHRLAHVDERMSDEAAQLGSARLKTLQARVRIDAARYRHKAGAQGNSLLPAHS